MRYRFEDTEIVAIDTARQRVWVGGAEVICQPRVYQLLVMLCEAGGAVVAREEIFARLWKGQAITSDESLTQVVHRLRAMLGPASAAVRTVRGVGFRLDAALAAEAAPAESPQPDAESHAPPPSPVAPPISSPPPAPAAQTRSGGAPPAAAARGSRRWWALAALPVAAAAAWLGLWRPRQVIDSRFALERGDLAGARPQTIDLVSRALAAERLGDRGQARHLLETASETDLATAVPAALRGLFSRWQDHPEEARQWAAEAERRLRPGSSPYLHLLVRYVREQAAGRDADWLAADSALLTLRPAAWYLRLARAHFNLARRESAAALADLQQIPIPALNDQSLALVLADRASLGDVAGAERDLASGLLHGQEALAWYVRGRLARSRHRPVEARDAFDREVAAALRLNQPDLITEARIMGAVAAAEAGDFAAAGPRFDQAALTARSEQRWDQAAEALGLGAYLAWRRGDAGGRDRRLAEAASLAAVPSVPFRAALALLALWTGARPAEDVQAMAAAMPTDEVVVAGVDELLLGRRAWAAGDRQEAARRLSRARAAGVDKTFFLEEGQLLAADLGERPQPLWIDPPYPNGLRFAAVWELERRGALARP
jgi:DNA-binding winged helix-turn-helix (wHTH) protein